ncbi:aryl hydrocarbon receptor-like [Salvelinus sp. IW2-2015]|uniref:aryl hydrocarbon receptor-like n=1 Tax=Salvelinus sp. IW2-2015 TaxID=2691554 RepID=UPI0038D4E65C
MAEKAATAENDKDGESGMTVFRLLTKLTGWVWVQANARLSIRTDGLSVSSHPKESSRDSLAGDTTGPAGNTTNNNQDGTLDLDSLLGSLLKQDKTSPSTCAASLTLRTSSNSRRRWQGFRRRRWQGFRRRRWQGFRRRSAGFRRRSVGSSSSSSWQEGSILSLQRESSSSRSPWGWGWRGINGFSLEDRDGDLWSFMMNLGIRREDLELFQQDEMFLDVDLDAGRDGLLPDLTDEILSTYRSL